MPNFNGSAQHKMATQNGVKFQPAEFETSKMKIKSDVTELVDTAKRNNTYLKVCAPMVRYSKVQFRTLVRQYTVRVQLYGVSEYNAKQSDAKCELAYYSYGADLCFSPMILANSFCQSSRARSSEFSTTMNDSPLIVQFAANNPNEFVDASQLVYPYADGVDLNCGCPQRWAIKDGVGCALLSQPNQIHTLIRQFKNALPNNFSISVKIRILSDLKKTIDLCRQLENCGITLLTIHGRTQLQKNSEDVNTIALSEVCKSIQIPIIANGGVKSLQDASDLHNEVGCCGIMAASGLLTNPALFSGAAVTPPSCIQQWLNICKMERDRMTFQCYHHHLVFMLEKVLTKNQKQVFNYLNTYDDVNNFLITNFCLDVNESLDLEYVTCQYSDLVTRKHSTKCRLCHLSQFYCTCKKYDSNISDGKYFSSYISDNYMDDIDILETSIFHEN